MNTLIYYCLLALLKLKLEFASDFNKKFPNFLVKGRNKKL